MANEDILNGARTAWTFYDAYLNAVGEEIGEERALALHTKMCETMGRLQGKTIREQAGDQDFDAKTVYSLVKGVPESLGIVTEVLEETPTSVRFKCKQCPVFEAAYMAGLNDSTREAVCRDGSIGLMDEMVKQLNPNLSYRLMKFRSAADDFCEEEIALVQS